MMSTDKPWCPGKGILQYRPGRYNSFHLITQLVLHEGRCIETELYSSRDLGPTTPVANGTYPSCSQSFSIHFTMAETS